MLASTSTLTLEGLYRKCKAESPGVLGGRLWSKASRARQEDYAYLGLSQFGEPVLLIDYAYDLICTPDEQAKARAICASFVKVAAGLLGEDSALEVEGDAHAKMQKLLFSAACGAIALGFSYQDEAKKNPLLKEKNILFNKAFNSFYYTVIFCMPMDAKQWNDHVRLMIADALESLVLLYNDGRGPVVEGQDNSVWKIDLSAFLSLAMCYLDGVPERESVEMMRVISNRALCAYRELYKLSGKYAANVQSLFSRRKENYNEEAFVSAMREGHPDIGACLAPKEGPTPTYVDEALILYIYEQMIKDFGPEARRFLAACPEDSKAKVALDTFMSGRPLSVAGQAVSAFAQVRNAEARAQRVHTMVSTTGLAPHPQASEALGAARDAPFDAIPDWG